jgi:AcrR family transcriptional regulator
MSTKVPAPSRALLLSVREAFHRCGYKDLSMVSLADACGISRRGLYNYFRNKDEAFRAWVRYSNEEAIRLGLSAGDQAEARGADVVDVFTAILDVRYGETRREVEGSPHKNELMATALMLCRDIIVDAAVSFQRELANRVSSFADQGAIGLNEGMTPDDVAELLANGARGVNQGLPPPTTSLEERYRQMCRAVLFGTAEAAEPRARRFAVR